MKNQIALAVLVLLAIIGLFSSTYVVSEPEQVFITRFGKIPGVLKEPVKKDGNQTEAEKEEFQKLQRQFEESVGKAIKVPGLHFKMPFVDKVRRFERRILEWDGPPSQITTKDKRFIAIDTYARWRISNPVIFFRKVKDEIYAQSRLNDILNSTTRSAVANHDLVEVVRSEQREAIVDANQTGESGQQLQTFLIGRKAISSKILADSQPKVAEYGIELLDFQFKRINYAPQVQAEIFKRMIAERKKIAEGFRSEGQGQAAEIDGKRQRQLDTIESEATRQEKEIQGRADAEAAKIYAEAFAQSPESEEFYKFIKTMETYKLTLSQKDLLILSTKSEFFSFLKEIKPKPAAPK
jgi:modulator of FtsH protease HflC